MERKLKALSIIAALSSVISACAGIFCTGGSGTRTVDNIYGQRVVLYGDGIYANDSLLKAGATKGTDIVIIAVGLVLIAVLLFGRGRKAHIFIRSGLLLVILYATTCLIMGMSFNRLFLLYVLQWGSSLFAFLISLYGILDAEVYDERIYERHLKGTGIFMLIAGCSASVWLTFILPALVMGRPLATIETYTTEPTFAVDLAVILPAQLFCGVALLKKRKVGYKLAPVLLTLLAGVGACVITQTIFQRSLGIVLPTSQMFGLVGSFVILGSVALALNARLLRFAR